MQTFFFSAWKFGDAPAEQVVKFWFDFEEATVIALETKLLCEHAICGLYPVFLFTSPSSILEHHPYCWLNHNVFCLKLPSLWVKLSFSWLISPLFLLLLLLLLVLLLLFVKTHSF